MHLKEFVCSHNSHHSTSSNPFSLLLRHRIRRPDGPCWHWPCDRQINIFQILPTPTHPNNLFLQVVVMFEEMGLLILLLIVQTSTKQYIVLQAWRFVLVKSNSNLNVTKAAPIHIMTKFPGSAFNWRQLGVGRLLNAGMSLDRSHNSLQLLFLFLQSAWSSKCYCYQMPRCHHTNPTINDLATFESRSSGKMNLWHGHMES